MIFYIYINLDKKYIGWKNIYLINLIFVCTDSTVVSGCMDAKMELLNSGKTLSMHSISFSLQ
jgi:hypothetical protein